MMFWLVIVLVIAGIGCLVAGKRAIGGAFMGAGVVVVILTVFHPEMLEPKVDKKADAPVRSSENVAQATSPQLPDAKENKNAEAPVASGGDAAQADYPKLLSMVVARVEQESPSGVPSDFDAGVKILPPSGGSHRDADRQAIPPFLLLPIDIVLAPHDGQDSQFFEPGVKAIRSFLEGDPATLRIMPDAFSALSNFPVMENREGLFYDLIRQSKNRAVRVGAVLALRDDVFAQGQDCDFLSTLLTDPDHDVQYAAMLSLATSDQLSYMQFQMEAFPTDNILSRIDSLMHTGFQIKMVVPIARVLSRSPYVRNPMVHKIRENLRNVSMDNSANQQFFAQCLAIVDAAK